MKTLTLSLLCLAVLTACEPPLPQPGPTEDGGETDAGLTDGGTPNVTTRVEGDVSISNIAGTNDNAYTAFDLDTSSEVPFEPADWDLAFQRFHVRSRGGASGNGGVQVAPLDAGFDDVTAVPTSGWLEDQPDGSDENENLDTVFETAAPWFSYEGTTHILTPTPTTYVVRSDKGAFFKVKIEGYYDVYGTPANFKLRWAKLP